MILEVKVTSGWFDNEDETPDAPSGRSVETPAQAFGVLSSVQVVTDTLIDLTSLVKGWAETARQMEITWDSGSDKALSLIIFDDDMEVLQGVLLELKGATQTCLASLGGVVE